MSLSPMIVTRLLSASFSLRMTWRPICRSSSALSGWIKSPSTASALATVATTLVLTRISVPVMTTSSVSFGCFSAIDSGSLTARGLAIVSTPPTFDSRKKIRIVNTSISDTRFMSTIVWLRPFRSARFCSGVSFIAAGLGRLPDRRVADGDVREVVGVDDLRALHLGARSHRVHHLHELVVRRGLLRENGRVALVGKLQLDALDQRRQMLHVGPGRQVRNAFDQAADAVADLDRLGPDHDLELEQLVRVELLELLVRLRRQCEVDHGQVREHRDRQQERHQHHDQVDERGDLEVSRRLAQAANGHGGSGLCRMLEGRCRDQLAALPACSERSRCTRFRKLILAASRPSTISLVLACRNAWMSRKGIATISAKAVLFMAIEIEAESISAFSAGLTCATAVKPLIRPMMVPSRPTSVMTLAKVAM